MIYQFAKLELVFDSRINYRDSRISHPSGTCDGFRKNFAIID